VIIRLLISLSAISLILYVLRDKLDEAFVIMTQVRWEWFFVAALAYIVCQGIAAYRLHLIFEGQEIRVKFWETLYFCLVGCFFNLFLPSAVGGDIAKAYYIYKRCGKKIEATASVILDRFMGFVSLMLIVFIALAFLHREIKDPRIAYVVYVFLGLVFFLLVFFFNKRFANVFKFLVHLIPERFRVHISDAYHAIYNYRRHKRIIFSAILLSMIGQVFMILMPYCVARSLGVELSVWLFFVLMPLIAIVSMAPSMGGLGVREAGSVYLFSRYMLPETALALSLLLDILIYGFSLAAGVVYTIRGELKSEVIHEMEALE